MKAKYGHFGIYGGQYVPEALMAALEELDVSLGGPLGGKLEEPGGSVPESGAPVELSQLRKKVDMEPLDAASLRSSSDFSKERRADVLPLGVRMYCWLKDEPMNSAIPDNSNKPN